MAIGERVGAARADAGLTQAQLAAAIGMDRSVLAKIETGARRVSAVELVAIARELSRRVEWFVEPGPPAIVSYRAEHPEVASQAIDDKLDRLVRDVTFVAGQEPALTAGQPEIADRPSGADAAEALAVEARHLLGLNQDQPAVNLSELIANLGLMVFSLHLDAGADGGTVLLDRGGVTLVNGDQPVGRRRLTLAHELGHYLVADPYTTDWRVAAPEIDALESRLDRFARSLLLPADDLRDRWHSWTSMPGETLRDAAVRAGSHYRVDMATLARRLTELGLADSGDANLIRQVRTKKADIVEKNLFVAHELEPVSLPRRYEQAVLRLYRSETISVDRALDLLHGTFDQDSLPDLPPVPEGQIWTAVS